MTEPQIVLKSRIHDQGITIALGLHPWERHRERPTRLVVNVTLSKLTSRSALMANEYMDYDQIRQYIASWQDRPHTELLETLATDLIDFCFANSKADTVEISLKKPDIFIECADVGIEVSATRMEWLAD